MFHHQVDCRLELALTKDAPLEDEYYVPVDDPLELRPVLRERFNRWRGYHANPKRRQSPLRIRSPVRRLKRNKGVIIGFSFTAGAREEVARAKNHEGLEIELKTVKELVEE